jgi:hypothetical protein
MQPKKYLHGRKYDEVVKYIDNEYLLFNGNLNLLSNSDKLDNAVWTKSDTTILTNQINSPITGNLTVDKIVETATTTIHQISTTFTTKSNEKHCLSFYVKPVERQNISVVFKNNTGDVELFYATFNLTLGTVLSNNVLFTKIEQKPDGWFFIRIIFDNKINHTANVGITYKIEFRLGNSSTNNNRNLTYLGDTSSGLFLDSIMINLGEFEFPYTTTFNNIPFNCSGGWTFNLTGTKLYCVGGNPDDLYQFDLEIPWDIKQTTNKFSINKIVLSSTIWSLAGLPQDSNPCGITLKNDGTKFWIFGRTTGNLLQFTLSVPYEIDSLVFDTVITSITELTGTFNIQSIKFSNDGYYFVFGGGQYVYTYQLSIPYDLTTAVFVSNGYNLGGTQDFFFSENGQYVFRYNTAGSLVRNELSIPWVANSIVSNKNISIHLGSYVYGNNLRTFITPDGLKIFTSTANGYFPYILRKFELTKPYKLNKLKIVERQNTFIGGMGTNPNYNTTQKLATRLGINFSRITNFEIKNNNIYCRISGSYGLGGLNNSEVTFYIDLDGLVTNLGSNTFQNCYKLRYVYFPGIVTLNSGYTFRNAKTEFIILPNIYSILSTPFYGSGDNFIGNFKNVYMPLLQSVGTTLGNTQVFYGERGNLYVHNNLSTINSGSPDGDLTAYTSINPIYITDYTKPNKITDLTHVVVHRTHVEIDFTIPSSTNQISHYEVWVNDAEYKNCIYNTNNKYILKLEPSTFYYANLIVVDIFGNRSEKSNTIYFTTNLFVLYDAVAATNIELCGVSDNYIMDAIQEFVYNLKGADIFSKMIAIYLCVDDYGLANKYNLINYETYELINGFLSYSKGYVCSGNQPRTQINPSLVLDKNNFGLTTCIGTKIPTTSLDLEMGSFDSNTKYIGISNFNGAAVEKRFYFGTNSPAYYLDTTGDGRGIVTGIRNETNAIMYFNGVEVDNKTPDGDLPTQEIVLGGRSAYYNTSKQRMQFTAIHQALTQSELELFHDAINLFELMMDRKTW